MDGEKQDESSARVQSAMGKLLDKLMDSYTEHQLEMVATSFCFLDREPKKRRLQAIMDLSAERQRLLDEHGRYPGRPDLPQGFQASAFMGSVIQYLIEGDLGEVKNYADMYLFEGEGEWAKEWIEVYAKFRGMALAAASEESEMQ